MNAPLLTARANTASCALSLADLKRFGDGWVLDSEYRQLAPQTLYSRRTTLDKLLWWLRQKEYESCGTLEIRGFLAYVASGDAENGRWGNPHETKKNRPVTAATYYSRLRAFFQFLIAEGYIEASPMANLKPPIHRADQIQPFSEAQVASLLEAAKHSKYPRRNEAIVLFLLDTGVRASELCGLQIKDVDIPNRKAIVLGKGNKHRAVFLSRRTGKALWQYLKEEEREPTAPLFLSAHDEPLTRSGLLQLIERLGATASIEATRCSPHTFRHTCAIWFLRNGGQVFSLQQMLGHTDLKMTARYVAIAQADVQNQHMKFSPVERLKRRAK